MTVSYYKEKWQKVRENKVSIDELKRLSRQIAYSFLDFYLKDCYYEKEYIDLLCEMTTFFDDPLLNNPGAQALFGVIVESLCDDFEALQTVTYNRVMTQVISFCRKIKSGKELDENLNNFGIYTQKDLAERIIRVRNNKNLLPDQKSVKKILLLSRVTIGADVAITSVIIQRLADFYPDAEIALIGADKVEEVYAGNPRIRIRKVNYSRRGGLLPRLNGWNQVLKIIREETKDSSFDKTILIDPDSRLSQLGIMPLAPFDRYFFFDSRSDSALNNKMSMVELANTWMNKITDEKNFAYPSVWLDSLNLKRAASLCNSVKDYGAKRLIVINFGVGDNPRKRVGYDLEERLLLTLLQEPDTVILLDKGFGDEELMYSNLLLKAVKDHGYFTFNTVFSTMDTLRIKHGVIGIECRIGEIAALIAESDEFIGYDSACQHIAAALKTPCLTIFAGSNNMRFIRRWSAYGQKSCHIVHVDTLTDPASIDVEDLITRIMHIRSMRS